MGNDLWDDEPQEEFLDRPDETQLDGNKQPMHAPQVQIQSPPRPRPSSTVAPQPTEEYPTTFQGDVELEHDGEDDFTEILNDANLRIEQGRLYQMIMNHSLFEGMEADARAVQNVQREIRKFARESMEVMLGMRGTTPASCAVPAVSSPFNDLEVDILKKIASKATNGATESPEANQVAHTLKETPKRQTMNPIGGSTALKRTAPAAPAKPVAKPLPAKPSTPVKRTRMETTVDQILAEEGVSRKEVELEYSGIGKPLHLLTPEELVQRQKETARRLASRTTVKSSQAIPMASPEQQEMLAITRATQMNSVDRMDGLKIPGGMAALLEKVKQMPIKNNGE